MSETVRQLVARKAPFKVGSVYRWNSGDMVFILSVVDYNKLGLFTIKGTRFTNCVELNVSDLENSRYTIDQIIKLFSSDSKLDQFTLLEGEDLKNYYRKLAGESDKTQKLPGLDSVIKDTRAKLEKLGFQLTKNGVVAYKTFGSEYDPPSTWNIKVGSTINEICNHQPYNDCGAGINLATLEWVEEAYGRNETIYKLFIKNSWLPGVCVPVKSDGKVRCERAKIVGELPYNDPVRVDLRASLDLD